MVRERALKILLILVGLAFLATFYPLVASLVGVMHLADAEQMIVSIYAPIGVFLLLAVRDPQANRTLIACVGWSTLAHGAVMILQALQGRGEPGQLVIASVIALVSAALVVLPPPRRIGRRAAAATAALSAPAGAVR